MSRANESAYPLIGQRWSETTLGEREVCSTGGLTIREHFAAQFMAAMISNPVYDALEACLYSERAVMYADQLIDELAKAQK
jgi:hypothetical protein